MFLFYSTNMWPSYLPNSNHLLDLQKKLKDSFLYVLHIGLKMFDKLCFKPFLGNVSILSSLKTPEN